MKMRTIKLDPKFLINALQGKTSSFAANLPRDVQLLDLKFDLSSNQILAVIRSDGFEDIAELYPIPELKLAYEKKPQASSEKPLANTKVEAKAADIVKPRVEQVEKRQPPPNQTSSKMEQEFTPEQRKLLSFKVEGEQIIVKPTQFLKGEWEDINDVVKSLGGKWVKGDIISYWEIPAQ